MQYTELLKYKPVLMRIFEEYGVTRAQVFGSVAKGSAGSDSDIDFLISWPIRHSLIDRLALKDKLENTLHVKVDLVTDKTLHPLIREDVLREARDL